MNIFRMYSLGSTIHTNSSLRPNMNPIRALLGCIGLYKFKTYDLIHLPWGEGWGPDLRYLSEKTVFLKYLKFQFPAVSRVLTRFVEILYLGLLLVVR